MSTQPLPPNFVRRRTCRTSCIARALTCVRRLPGNLLAATRRKLFVVMERRNTPFARHHVYPWRPPTAPRSAPPMAASTRTTLALRVSCIATHLLTSCPGAQLKVKPPAFVVIPVPSFPQAEQFLLIVVHEFSHFILHVACSFVFVVFMKIPRILFASFGSLLLFPGLQLQLVLSQLFLHCSGNLMYPCSCLFHVLVCAVRTNTSVSMRACAFTLHPHSNLARVGDRPYARVDKSWSSFITCSQPKHAQFRYCCSRSRHGHDRHALHSRIHFRRQLMHEVATASRLRFVRLTLEFRVIFCPSSCTPLF